MPPLEGRDLARLRDIEIYANRALDYLGEIGDEENPKRNCRGKRMQDKKSDSHGQMIHDVDIRPNFSPRKFGRFFDFDPRKRS